MRFAHQDHECLQRAVLQTQKCRNVEKEQAQNGESRQDQIAASPQGTRHTQ